MFPLGVWKEEKLVSLQIEIIKMKSTEFIKLNTSPLSPASKFYGFEKDFSMICNIFLLFLHVGVAQKQQKHWSTP